MKKTCTAKGNRGRRNGLARAILLAAAAGLVVTACGADDGSGNTTGTTDDAAGDGAVTDGAGGEGGSALAIGGVLPLSGESAEFGGSMARGMELAAEQINTCGVLDVSLHIEDDGTDEQTAIGAIQKLVNVDDVPAIVGSVASRITLAIADTAIQNQRVLVAPGSSSPVITDYDDDGYLFRTLPSDLDQAPAIAEVAVAREFRQVNVVALNDDYGKGLSQAFSDSFEASGGSVGTVRLIDPKGVDFAADVRAALRDDPDALLLAVFPETGSAVLRALAQQGAIGETPLLMMNGLAVAGFPEQAGVDLDGEVGVRPTSGGPGDDYFTEQFQEKFDTAPGYATSNAYDATMLIALAAAAGEPTGPAIRDHLRDVSAGGTQYTPDQICAALEAAAAGEDVDYTGASSNAELDENGDLATPVFDEWTFEDGTPVRLRVLELGT
ncbi:ABC transporter substrate-binding protein [Phytoactinopolyspora limicola]|uniref:ABC transporter substrate-binding protein n=1 Tax=Phytoactinopolyspora limicola TaxID=2715536 RepID=UPI001407CD69|nr:ABC transporter substrate-binding protein [Phytoactinopolyspora limicola]